MKNEWEILQQMLLELPETTMINELYIKINDWVNNSFLRESPIFFEYGFDSYVNLDINLYPTKYSELIKEGFSNFQSRIKNRNFKKNNSNIVFLRNLFEEILIYETNIVCPDCHKTGMGVFYSDETNQIILLCHLICGKSYYENLTPITTSQKIKPIKTYYLESFLANINDK